MIPGAVRDDWLGLGSVSCSLQFELVLIKPFTDLLKNKSRPEAAAHGAAAWVISERELREKLRKEREARKAEEEREVCLLSCKILSIRG